MNATVTVNMKDGTEDQFEDEINGDILEYTTDISKEYPEWSSLVIVIVNSP